MSRLASGLSTTIFQSSRPKTIVVGPDAFAIDSGDPGFSDDTGAVLTVYDLLVNRLVGATENGDSPHETHDLFLATELWMHRNGYRNEISKLYDFHIDFFEEIKDVRLPLINQIAQLPFRYYINFGMEGYLSERVLRIRPRARIFNISLDDLRERWHKNDRASDDAPWVINLLGRVGESTCTYMGLADLFSEVLQDQFLHDQMKQEINKGSVLYLGMQLRYWYTRILMLALRSETTGRAGARRAFELRAPYLDSETRCIELYSANTSNIEMQLEKYDQILDTLRELKKSHKITTVFISYRHEEEQRMVEIAEHLRENGQIIVSTSAEFSHEVGSDWERIRTDSIERSDCYIQLITASMHNNRNSDCWNELKIALESHAPRNKLIPVLYDGLDINQIAPELADKQVIREDAPQWIDRLYDRITRPDE